MQFPGPTLPEGIVSCCQVSISNYRAEIASGEATGETRLSLPNGDIVSLSVAVSRIATRGVASSGKASVPAGCGELLSNHQFDDGVGVFGSC